MKTTYWCWQPSQKQSHQRNNEREKHKSLQPLIAEILGCNPGRLHNSGDYEKVTLEVEVHRLTRWSYAGQCTVVGEKNATVKDYESAEGLKTRPTRIISCQGYTFTVRAALEYTGEKFIALSYSVSCAGMFKLHRQGYVLGFVNRNT